MADDQHVENTILGYINREYADALAGTPLVATTPLISSGLIDSLSMVSLKVFVENTYGVRIPDAEASAEAFDSVAALVALVRKLKAGSDKT
jgi:acyl carrier protein